MAAQVAGRRKARLEQLGCAVERIGAHEEAAARLKGGGRWGTNNPWTGDCFGLPQEDCGGLKY